jgi:hypothetical protein
VIRVTDEMVTAFMDAGTGGYGDVVDAVAGLEAVMALIDPVPNDVTTLVTLDNEELTRVMAGGPSPERRVGTDVWRHECGCCYSTFAELLADGAIEPNA